MDSRVTDDQRAKFPALKHNFFARHAFAVCAIAVGLLLRVTLERLTGSDLPTYITFYPAVMIVTLLAGLGPGLLATFTAVFTTFMWVIPSHGRLELVSLGDATGIGLFTLLGILMNFVAYRYRRMRDQYRDEVSERISELQKKNEALRVGLSEQKRIQSELTASEIRYRRLFEAAKDGILILDADSGEVVEVNPFLTTLLGYTHDELLGKELWQIGMLRDIAASKDAFLELKERGYVRYEGLPLQTKDGRRIEVEFVSNVYFINNTKVIQCNIRDITERRRVEETVKQASEELAAVVQSLVEPVIIFDIDGTVINSNRASADALGFEPSGMSKEKFLATLNLQTGVNGAFGRGARTINQALGGVVLRDVEFRYTDTQGNVHIVLLSATPISRTGIPTRMILTWHDITERVRIEEMRNSLIRDLSHQLKTPLSVIEMASNLLLKAVPKNSTAAESENIEMITRNTLELRKLISNILHLSSLESGKTRVKKEMMDLSATLSSVVRQLKPLADGKRLDVHLSAPSKLDYFSDEEKVRDILLNTIENAIKFTETGSIDISVAERADCIEVQVKDTGIGMTSAQMKNVFTKFYKVDPSVSGTGLGLNIVQENMRLLRGEVKVSSDGLNKGSTFILTFTT